MAIRSTDARGPSYPSCPVCEKATFLYHDKKHLATTAAVTRSATIHCLYQGPVLFRLYPCPSTLERRTSIDALPCPCDAQGFELVYLCKNSFRNIALILRIVMNIQASHTTISNWCIHFVPMFQNIAIQLIPSNNLIFKFIFFYNFVLLTSALNGLTPAQCTRSQPA